MKQINLILVVILFTVILSSCSTEKGSFYEMTYIVRPDTLISIERDSLITIEGVVNLKQQINGEPDTTAIDGDILKINGSVISTNGDTTRTFLTYRLNDNTNKDLLEIRITDSDAMPGFDNIKIIKNVENADINKISSKIDHAMAIIDSFAHNQFEMLKVEGKTKFVDLYR